MGRSISWVTICRDVGGWNLTYPSNAGYLCAREACIRECPLACAYDTNINYETSTNPRTRMDDVAYSPICLVASGEKTKWLSGAGFSPYAHALSPRRPNRVPNVEQRRHTNPHGYPGRRARGVILSYAFRRFLSVSPLFPARPLLSAVRNVD